MKVKVIKRYFDKKLDAYQDPVKDGKDNILEVDEARAKVLVAAQVAVVVEELPEEEPEVAPAQPNRTKKASKG